MANVNVTYDSDVAEDVISRETQKIITKIFSCFIWPVVLATGLCGNSLNIAIYARMGLKDSVTIAFLALSISDLLYLIGASVVCVCTVIAQQPWQYELPVSMFSLAGYITWYEATFIDISMAIVTYIALAKCCCVSMALNFKTTFTVNRTIFIILIIILACVGTLIPTLASGGLSWQTSSFTNSSRLTLWYSDNYQDVTEVTLTLSRVIYPNTVLLLVIACSVILTRSLVIASRVRKRISGRRQAVNEINEHNSKEKTTLSARETQVVKAVTVVSVFLLVCVCVMSIGALTQVFVPEYQPGRKFSASFYVMITIENTLFYLNASVNFFVYIKFNSNFKRHFVKMCAGLLQFELKRF